MRLDPSLLTRSQKFATTPGATVTFVNGVFKIYLRLGQGGNSRDMVRVQAVIRNEVKKLILLAMSTQQLCACSAAMPYFNPLRSRVAP